MPLWYNLNGIKQMIIENNSSKQKEEKIKLKKQVKGITLVVLVVTVIVLLILSGVAISLSIGEDGIFRRAQEGA